MVENRMDKLRKYKAKHIRYFVYALWLLVFAFNMMFSKNTIIIIFSINSIILGILICLEIYSR